jgi:hypothetical protein
MIKKIIDKKFLIILVLSVVATHLCLVAMPQVNLEFAFVDATKFFSPR